MIATGLMFTPSGLNFIDAEIWRALVSILEKELAGVGKRPQPIVKL